MLRDIYVTVAAFLLVILILVYYKEEDLEEFSIDLNAEGQAD